MNVFERIFLKPNWYFWFTMAFVSLVQILMVQWFAVFTRTTPLTRSEWGACIVAGATSLLIAALLKFWKGILGKIPFTKFVDEDKENEDGMVNKIVAYSNKTVNVNPDMFKKGKKDQEGYDALNEGDYGRFENDDRA